jgi:hypothetical protein
MEKKQIISTENELLKARSEGLARAKEIHTMQAHGKYELMDVFSWINPQFDMLATVLTSFPYPVIWIATQKQAKCALTYYPEVQDNIESIIVHDEGYIKLKGEIISDISNIILVGDFESAIKSMQAMKRPKRILLYTSEGETAESDQRDFQNYIDR